MFSVTLMEKPKRKNPHDTKKKKNVKDSKRTTGKKPFNILSKVSIMEQKSIHKMTLIRS
jgi:hypothetical protein